MHEVIPHRKDQHSPHHSDDGYHDRGFHVPRLAVVRLHDGFLRYTRGMDFNRSIAELRPEREHVEPASGVAGSF